MESTDNDHGRVEWLARATTALAERPEVHRRLMKAIDADDVDAFSRAATAHWRKYGIEPPPDKCDPYVTGYLFVVKEPEVVEVCTWVGAATISLPPTSATTYSFSGTSTALIEWLKAKGLVQCHYELRSQNELLVIKKFVQGICPPGTF